jgi:fucose permease
MDLRLSHHAAQVLTTPVKIISNMLHRKKERHFREYKLWEFLYLANQVTCQKVYVESVVNAKFDVFLDVFFIIMTLFFLPKQYI